MIMPARPRPLDCPFKWDHLGGSQQRPGVGGRNGNRPPLGATQDQPKRSNWRANPKQNSSSRPYSRSFIDWLVTYLWTWAISLFMKYMCTGQGDLGNEHDWPASLSLYRCSPSLKTQDSTIPVGPGSMHGAIPQSPFPENWNLLCFSLDKYNMYLWLMGRYSYRCLHCRATRSHTSISSWWKPVVATLLSMKPWSAEKGCRCLGSVTVTDPWSILF